MKSRSHSQKNSKNANSSKSSGVGKKLRRISISDDSDESGSLDTDGQSNLPEFLDLPPYDLSSKCPTFKTVSDRDFVGHHSQLNVDELDSLQLELEKILYHTVSRTKQIRDTLTDLNDGRTAASSSSSVVPSSSTNLRSNQGLPENKRSKVKFATTVEVSKRSAQIATLSPLKIKPPKLNRTDHVTTSERSALSPGSSRLYLWPQNQMPDKFIHFVDNYAGPISLEVLNKLKELCKESDPTNSAVLQDCPNLGKHYSLRKPEIQPTVADGAKSSSSSKDKNKNGQKFEPSTNAKVKNGEISSPAIEIGSGRPSKSVRLLNNKQKNSIAADKTDDQCNLGPLTERLVQALIEENAFEPSFIDDVDCHFASNGSTPNATPTKILVKSLNLGNMAALERRIRKELEEQGLLDFEESGFDADLKLEPEDEVSAELRQRQKELDLLQKNNFDKLQSLIAKCELTIERQNLEERRKCADDHILDLCSRFYGAAPSSRKPSTKKEKDQLLKSLKDREKIIEELNNFNVS